MQGELSHPNKVEFRAFDAGFICWAHSPGTPRRRRRTGLCVAGHKLVGHAEQVPQHISLDARQANQHGVTANVMVRDVVNVGIRSEQLSPIVGVHANDKRARFGRAINGDTRHEFSMDLECRGPVRCALLDAGQRKSDIPHGVEVDCASGHRSVRFLKDSSSSVAPHIHHISLSLPLVRAVPGGKPAWSTARLIEVQKRRRAISSQHGVNRLEQLGHECHAEYASGT
jgi:hypothetical protein